MEKQWFETAILTAFLVFTAFAAYQDIKYGSIHVGVFIAGGAVGIFLQTGRLIAAFGSGCCWSISAVCFLYNAGGGGAGRRVLFSGSRMLSRFL